MLFVYQKKAVKMGKNRHALLKTASHSKTACRGFKSFCPCQKYRHRFCGACIFCLCVKFLKRGTRVPGNTRDRCRWQMKGACVGTAVGKIKDKRKPADFSGLPQEGIVCLLPLPEIQASLLRCLYFLSVRKILETRHARAGQHTRPLPVADEGSVCWHSGRKNQGQAQARRFFRVTARGHSLPSAPAKNKSLEISLNRAVSRLFFLLYISQFPYGARSARLFFDAQNSLQIVQLFR